MMAADDQSPSTPAVFDLIGIAEGAITSADPVAFVRSLGGHGPNGPDAPQPPTTLQPPGGGGGGGGGGDEPTITGICLISVDGVQPPGSDIGSLLVVVVTQGASAEVSGGNRFTSPARASTVSATSRSDPPRSV